MEEDICKILQTAANQIRDLRNALEAENRANAAIIQLHEQRANIDSMSAPILPRRQLT